MISNVARRIALSVALAVPLALLSFAIADSVRTPEVIRYLIAPGYLLILHMSSGGNSFGESLNREMSLALTTDTAYYGLLIFLVLSRPPARHTNPPPK